MSYNTPGEQSLLRELGYNGKVGSGLSYRVIQGPDRDGIAEIDVCGYNFRFMKINGHPQITSWSCWKQIMEENQPPPLLKGRAIAVAEAIYNGRTISALKKKQKVTKTKILEERRARHQISMF